MSSMCMNSENHGRCDSTQRQTGRPGGCASRREKPKVRVPSPCVSVNANDSECSLSICSSSTSGKQNSMSATLFASTAAPPWPCAVRKQ
eukprot:scaffold24847_cov58-Phaeocystis_antarctica.AAC.2